MKTLYCARIARFDLLRQVNRLARNITRWTTDDDKKLNHLMCYIHHTKHWMMIDWVGDSVEDMYLAVYGDSDFSGCADSLRSTSGGRMNLQGPNTRFLVSGSSKRQGCVSLSTPEAEIVAADVAMRAMGMPAFRLMERVLGKEPKFVFFDDNKAMITVVRSGKNPTMRHLERSHGVAVTWMHDMFERGYMYLAYEVRMAADIYTKDFSDSRKWRHACVQIGLLEREMLTDPEALKMVTSSFDPKKGAVQAATGSINGIPTIMPPDLWWQGLSSKEGLHEHEGHDPVIVAKVPKLMRYQPPPTVQCPIGTRWLRSTWFLCGGSWEKVGDRAEPALPWERIDKYVERAVWQFHPAQPAAPAPKVIQPRQHFGRDESFQRFIQEADGTSWTHLSIFYLRVFYGGSRQ